MRTSLKSSGVKVLVAGKGSGVAWDGAAAGDMAASFTRCCCWKGGAGVEFKFGGACELATVAAMMSIQEGVLECLRRYSPNPKPHLRWG